MATAGLCINPRMKNIVSVYLPHVLLLVSATMTVEKDDRENAKEKFKNYIK